MASQMGGSVEASAALLALKEFEVNVPSFMLPLVAIGCEDLPTKDAWETMLLRTLHLTSLYHLELW